MKIWGGITVYNRFGRFFHQTRKRSRLCLEFYTFTASKWSLGEGNIFTGICKSFCPQGGSLYDVTCCLAAWFHVPSGDLCPWSHVPTRGLYPGGVSVQGGLCPRGGLFPRRSPPWNQKSRQHASYWNTFLFCFYFWVTWFGQWIALSWPSHSSLNLFQNVNKWKFL